MNHRKAVLEFTPKNAIWHHLAITIFILYLIGPILFITTIATIVAACSSFSDSKIVPVEILLDMIFLMLGLQIVYWCPIFMNQYNAIRVFDKGIHVRIFDFRYRWTFIQWDDIIDIRLLSQLDPWKQPLWGIIVKGFTPWHRLLGQIYGVKKYSVILLSSQIDNRDILIQILLEKIRQGQ